MRKLGSRDAGRTSWRPPAPLYCQRLDDQGRGGLLQRLLPVLLPHCLWGRGGFVPAVTVPFPGLYGRDGILPARRVLRLSGKGLWEQLRDLPTLLWLSPHLGLDTELGMELLCLLGALAAFGALLFEPLRDSLLFALLTVLYLSLYQV